MDRHPFDPYEHDPARWGVSLAQMSELLLPCLDLAEVRCVAEVGAFAGDLTQVLVDWARGVEGRVVAIDPAPQKRLIALAEQHSELELVPDRSVSALGRIELPDAIVIDGDHNYHTVSEELRIVGERAGENLPLLLFHDVRWPHARRDDYFDVADVPHAARHPVAADVGGLFPGDQGLHPGGLPYPNSAAVEGGPRNGVLTAVEDFVSTRPSARFVVVPAFFGFGVVWDTRTAWSQRIEALLAPFDRHPLLERLEANRVHHLAVSQVRLSELSDARAQLSRQRALLERLLRSRAFDVADRLSRARVAARVAPEDSPVSKEEIRGVLDGAA